MNDELQKKLSQRPGENPVDEVIKKMLEKQAKCCVRAKIKLDELNKKVISELVD